MSFHVDHSEAFPGKKKRDKGVQNKKEAYLSMHEVYK